MTHEERLGCKCTWAQDQQIRDKQRKKSCIKKKQNGLGWKGSQSPSHLPLDHVAPRSMQPGLKYFQEQVPLENTVSGLKLPEDLHLFPILLIPTLRGIKHEQRSSHGLHRLRNLGKERKSCLLPTTLSKTL